MIKLDVVAVVLVRWRYFCFAARFGAPHFAHSARFQLLMTTTTLQSLI
jgi:hypothetical protein